MKRVLILLITVAMYLNLHAKIEINGVDYQISTADIEESVTELSDKATVTIPRNYKSMTGKSVLEVLKVGDPAVISLGTNENLHREFSGYIREIEADEPIRVHLDDEMYLLKKNSYNLSWKEVSLKTILTKIAPGYNIECPQLKLNKFSIINSSSYQVLMHLKKQYGLYSYIKDDKTLHCGSAYDVKDKIKETHVYEFARNIKVNSLKYKRKEDYKYKVIAIANKPDGKKLKLELGNKDNDAVVRTLNFGNVSLSELKKLATAELNKISFDGYTGTITGFATPISKAGDAVQIIDSKEPDREGSYLIEKVIIRYGKTYLERINSIKYKL